MVQTAGNRTIKEVSPGKGVGLKITFVKFYAAAP